MEKSIPGRLISLDVFRGLTIAAMIIVNYPGSWGHVYAPLLHKPWHGITPTDLIFPFFLFIVGVSIALAYSKRLEKGASKKEMAGKILFRGLKIFAVGIFLNLWPEFAFSELRVAGVLQRIALVFLASALLFIYTSWKTQAVIGGLILIAYWLALVLIPTPGYGQPLLEPGINLAAWIDSFLLPGRMWQGTWDPEGLLSTLPAIATGITGMLTGKILLSNNSREKKALWLFVAGFLSFIAGYAWSWVFPLNKPIWTSSYVLLTSGLGAMTLTACYTFIDIQGKTCCTRPWVILGTNAIAVYVLAGLLSWFFRGISIGEGGLVYHAFQWLTATGMVPKLASLILALLYLGILFIPATILYRKKIFIKL
ncbi:MAG: heparan-alpha-glucosaminide N-acetyltransferase domain-containing protein [Bacteroides sp.]|jgi:predicted acyltransferase|nr:heparan-alpha-glucosaminide N-acetyltransferase domain-containing protein [Bacteroides sp.]